MSAPAFAFKKASKKTAKARIALMGPSGSGKTKTALLMASGLGKRIAVLDTEHGSASKYAGDDGVEFDALELESFSPMTYVAAIHAAEELGYDVLIVDSLTHAWSGKGGALEQVDNAAKRSQSGNTYMAWRDVTPQHNELVDAMVRCKCHLIATLRTKTEYVLEDVTKGGKTTKQPRRVGLAPIQRDGMEYEFDIVADITLDHDLMVTKTRCTALDGLVVNKPGVKLGQQIAAWLSDGEPQVLPAVPQSEPANANKSAAPNAERNTKLADRMLHDTAPEAPKEPENPHDKDVFPGRWPYDNGRWAGTFMSEAPFSVVLLCKQSMRQLLSEVQPGSRSALAILEYIEKATYWVQKKNPDPTGALPNDGEASPIADKYYRDYFHENPDSEPRDIRDLDAAKLAVHIANLEKEALRGREHAERTHFYMLAARRALGKLLAAEAEAEDAEAERALSEPPPAPVAPESTPGPAPEPEAPAEAAPPLTAAPANATAEELKAWMDSQDIPKRTARSRLPKRATKDLDAQLAAATGKTVQQETR